MVKLKIDGKDVQIKKGTTILAAAETVGIKIPTLCYLKKISPTGACRVCVVEVSGADKPMTACNTVAVDGMAVTTQSEKLSAIRRQMVELLLVNHPLDCPVCDAAGECDLQDICFDLDVIQQPFAADDASHAPITDWPLIDQTPSRCVLCEKCVKVCHEVVGASALVVRERGEKAFIDTVDGQPLDCEFCGNCVSVCPTGTLTSKTFKFKARPWDMQLVPSVCTYCGSQCQIDLNVKAGEVYRVTSKDETVNSGNLCIGGAFGYGYIHASQRLRKPMAKKNGCLDAADWGEALNAVATRIREVRSSAGAGAIAGLASPRLTNEENYLFQKLFRAAIGSNNVDSEARFGAHRALKGLAGLGLKGASNRIDRIAKAEALLVFGSDITAEAPAVGWQIEAATRKNDAKLVVANMRRTKLAANAETFLAYRPGSEVALANALARLILDEGLADETFLTRYVANLDELKADLGAVDLDAASAATGLRLELLKEAAGYLGRADSVALIFGGDILKDVDGAAKSAALANLALVSGALHGDLGGLFPVDEKGNTQGLLDMGVAPEFFPGYQDYAQAKGKFEAAWKVTLPEGGKDAQGILEGIEKGEIKVLYLAATNPLVSFPEAGRWRKALEQVEFLVVQDIFDSELTRLADVVLPGVTFAEKEGTVTSLDHRVNPLKRAIPLPSEARADWEIFAELYNRVSAKGGKVYPEMVMQELKELTDLYTDVCTAGEGWCVSCQKEPYLPKEKGLRYVPVSGGGQPTDGLQLLSGKILFHFGTTSTFAEGNLTAAPAGYIEMNPADAAALQLEGGARIRVRSSVGSAEGPVRLSEQVPAGLLFAPYHFADVAIQTAIPTGGNRTTVEVQKL